MINCILFRNLATRSTSQCDSGWVTAQITSLNNSIGYHAVANVTRTWCIKDFGQSTWENDPCPYDGAERITFGTGQTSFAAAFLEFLNTSAGKSLSYVSIADVIFHIIIYFNNYAKLVYIGPVPVFLISAFHYDI